MISHIVFNVYELTMSYNLQISPFHTIHPEKDADEQVKIKMLFQATSKQNELQICRTGTLSRAFAIKRIIELYEMRNGNMVMSTMYPIVKYTIHIKFTPTTAFITEVSGQYAP